MFGWLVGFPRTCLVFSHLGAAVSHLENSYRPTCLFIQTGSMPSKVLEIYNYSYDSLTFDQVFLELT